MSDAHPARVTLLRGAALVASPWKNGGGVTREIAVSPDAAALDAFQWRVSVADVASAGPFSCFAGIDRTLVLLEGAGMLLDEAGGPTHALTRPFDIAYFAGETAITARLVDGATRDFNVMTRRGAVRADVAVWREAVTHEIGPHTTLLLHCAQGTAYAGVQGEGHVLSAGDTLRIDAADEALTLKTGSMGVLLAVAFAATSKH